MTLNGAAAPRVPHILNVSFAGVDGESLVSALPGLAVATGAACNSAQGEPSYVLRALGRSAREAESALRFSFGRFTTAADIEAAAGAVGQAVRRLRAISPDSPAQSCGADASPPTLGVQAGALSPAVRELFANLAGSGVLPEAPPEAGQVLRGEAGSAAAEAWVRLQLRVRDDTVIEARFQGLGCPHTLATASWLTQQLAGRSRRDVQPGTPAQWAGRLEIPVEKLGRLLIVEDALNAALAQWS